MTRIMLTQWLCRLIIGFTLVLSSASAATPAKPVTVGYLAVFKGLDLSIDRAHLPSFTHFNLSFANPDADGAFVRDGRMTCMAGAPLTVAALRPIVAKLQAGGAKVLVSVGGGLIPGCSGDWKALLAPGKRVATAAALVALADELGLDGGRYRPRGRTAHRDRPRGQLCPVHRDPLRRNESARKTADLRHRIL